MDLEHNGNCVIPILQKWISEHTEGSVILEPPHIVSLRKYEGYILSDKL